MEKDITKWTKRKQSNIIKKKYALQKDGLHKQARLQLWKECLSGFPHVAWVLF